MVMSRRCRKSLTIVPLVARHLFRLASSPKAEAGVAADPGKRSYSDHDTQKCGAAGTDRNGSDDGCFGVEFRIQLARPAARLGSRGHALLIVHLRVWLLQRDGVLFRVP